MSVNSYLTNLSNKLVLSSTENSNIKTSIQTLSKRLNDHFGGQLVEQVQFGSSTRETMLPRKADEHSDVDYMIVFSDGSSVKPGSLIQRLAKFAGDRYLSSEVFQSHPTIVLNLNHLKFELVPAYKSWGSYYIPASASSWSEWISTDPNGFNSSLVTKHKDNGYLIKPMIRLIKHWNAVNGYVYESFLLEKDIVGRWYVGCSSLSDYISMYFDWSSSGSLPQYKKDKVDRAKEIIKKVKDYQRQGNELFAELEIKKLFPEI